MFRRLKADKDTYITDRVIRNSRVTDANVGRAGTLDLFKLYNESTLSGTDNVNEISRILVHFDLDPLRSLTGSVFDIDQDFKATLSLKNVFGGDTVPSNFTVAVFPLSKSFDEGIGRDIGLFRDLDSANFITASVSGLPVTWSVSGAADPVNDYLETYGVYQVFEDGVEDLSVDVSSILSATLAGEIPDAGFRISFSGSQETDEFTRFAKRFGSRHVNDLALQPSIDVAFDDSIIDERSILEFGLTSSIFLFNYSQGSLANFVHSGQEVTGTDSLILRIVSGSETKTITSATLHQVFNSLTSSVPVDFVKGSPDRIVRSSGSWISEGYLEDMFLVISGTTSNDKEVKIRKVNAKTLQVGFGDTLVAETGVTASFTGSVLVEQSLSGTDLVVSGDFFEKVFTGSQYSINNNFVEGVYFANVSLDSNESAILQTNVSLASSASFDEIWQSLDGTKGFFTASAPLVFVEKGGSTNSALGALRRYVSFRNINKSYRSTEKVRFLAFVQDPLERVVASRLPFARDSLVFKNMYWQIVDVNSGKIIIPFETDNNGTRMSTSPDGMYFDFFMEDLDVGRVYGIETRIDSFGSSEIYTFEETGAVFRVDP
jgi:hypothetical protein